MSGQLSWRSAFPETEFLFRNVHVGKGSVSPNERGLGVAAAADWSVDQAWQLRFDLPPVLPSGTGKLRIRALADATTGAIQLNPKWKSVAVGEDPSTGALNNEGTSTITWSTNDDDEYQEVTLIDLDADTLVAGEIVVMDLECEDTSWTLAVVCTLIVDIIWE